MATELNLSRLNQQQMAQLINRPPSWLRERSHKLPRNSDGTYDGPKAIEWLLQHSQTLDPGLLSDIDAERAKIMAELLVTVVERDVHAVIKFVDDISDRYGDGGLAIVLTTFVDECRAVAEILGPPAPPHTEDDIRKRFARELSHALAWNGRTLFDAVTVCDSCDRIRRGTTWVEGAPPAGAIVQADTCPECKSLSTTPPIRTNTKLRKR